MYFKFKSAGTSKKGKKKTTQLFSWPDASWSKSFLLISVVKCLTLARNRTQSEKSHRLPSEQNPQTSISHWLQFVSFERLKREKGRKPYRGESVCILGKCIIYQTENNAQKPINEERKALNLLSKTQHVFFISSSLSTNTTSLSSNPGVIKACLTYLAGHFHC